MFHVLGVLNVSRFECIVSCVEFLSKFFLFPVVFNDQMLHVLDTVVRFQWGNL